MKEAQFNRRKAPDIWIYISRVLAVVSWCLFIIALVVSFYAAPDDDFGLLRYHGISIRDTWLMPLTNYLLFLLFSSALTSYLCLFLDKFRARRKTDSKHFNLILLLIILIAWTVYIFTY